MAFHLTGLLKKDSFNWHLKAFNWHLKAQEAFDSLKQIMTEAPVLKLSDFFKIVSNSNRCIWIRK